MDSERDENRGLKDLALRFFIYQYGFVYHLNITKQYNQSVLVISLSYSLRSDLLVVVLVQI